MLISKAYCDSNCDTLDIFRDCTPTALDPGKSTSTATSTAAAASQQLAVVAAGAPHRTTGGATHESGGTASGTHRRRRRGGEVMGAEGGGGGKGVKAGVDGDVGDPTRGDRVAGPSTAVHGGDGGGSTKTTTNPTVPPGTAAANKRHPEKPLETPPWMVLELLQEGGLLGPLAPLAARLNVSLPPLPRPSLDAIIASTGLNVSVLLGITDILTDTLNDLTDTISTGRLSVTVRGLLSQLPAFSLPAGTGGNGSTATTAAGLRPGLVMARRGYRAKHPVVIVPGFVTSGLELWQGLPCGRRYFRQRMWGTLAMVQDPAGIKIRAAVGLEAVDYFIQGYWVWGKLVEALADVGYDSNSLVSMPYDWRLAMPLLEERDGYFTRLRLTIEGLAEVSGERVVITAHSYGENVVRSFMSWVEAARSGWVTRYVAAIANIAGTTLGVPKSVSALLSAAPTQNIPSSYNFLSLRHDLIRTGETRDTAQLGALAGFLTSNLVPRGTRTRVWRTWGASYAMLPITRLDVSGFLALLREVGGPLVHQHMREWGAVDLSAGPDAASSTKGAGEGEGEGEGEAANVGEAEANPESGPAAGWTILKDVSDPGGSLDVGVQMSDGDGTVPLLSLGLMCRRGWRPGGSLNPGGMRVITREFKHRSVSLLQDARGGPATAAHIEILGNEAVLQDVIRIAAGRLDELSDVIHSDIDRIAASVEF
ncbi:hypothetical protein VOLCADRAFT_97885 [Volvox carteri f. nagariensis]|uniref:Phospholipid:diacylglycerol acyltransferase n=1 Tax=Volvox carteri f. nagariensis TaxID=3068 RepID=D8UDW7_VOLCA|nr:uncharacterized protein VOLCADRAFT_97885 [Volvox carteri f. nagariensis]EFJ42118.1 hypothetical protein VOLCADRAFT_97885 [Volvox carteri f. nagariensis]|eukprot:XP_002956815.1 hypothetical protein VOLCADRAFT_97885 [Volvox carteri f. nagariensis]